MSVTKSNEVVNRLNRTKKELYPDLAAEREAYDRVIRTQRKADVQAQKRAEKTAKAEAQKQEDLRSYKHLMQVCTLRLVEGKLVMLTSWQGYQLRPILCLMCTSS